MMLDKRWDTILMADSDHDPISYTALKVLQQRARTCTIPMCREMAEAAGIPWQSSWPRKLLRKMVGGKAQSGAYLQVRYDAMTHALKSYPGFAVLELAAGFGTRGVLEASHREAYIETDLLNLLRRKEKVVAKLHSGTTVSNHYFHPVNVTDQGEMAGIGNFVNGLNLQKPIVIIHEGLLMYFNHHEQEIVRDNIASLMRSHKAGAIWLTPDFSERNIDQTFLQKLMSLKLRGHVRRQLNYFSNNDAVERFLHAGGLDCEWLPNYVDPANSSTRAYAEYFRIHRITLQRR
jgi:O-methyltransferase involved in polyketide biosynthesis